MNKLETINEAVIKVIDEYPKGHQFFGNQLKDDVVKIFPKSLHTYPDTILRAARKHRRSSFRAINKNRSLYEKV